MRQPALCPLACPRAQSGDSALHLAARRGEEDLLKYLLEDLKLEIEQLAGEARRPTSQPAFLGMSCADCAARAGICLTHKMMNLRNFGAFLACFLRRTKSRRCSSLLTAGTPPPSGC